MRQTINCRHLPPTTFYIISYTLLPNISILNFLQLPPPVQLNDLSIATRQLKMASLRCIHSPSSANIFVQLARRTTSTLNSPATILSVLVPRWESGTTTATTSKAGFGTTRQCCTQSVSRRMMPQRFAGRTMRQQTRAFTASATRRQTKCAWNPKTDEEGQEMKLDITDRAGKVRVAYVYPSIEQGRFRNLTASLCVYSV